MNITKLPQELLLIVLLALAVTAGYFFWEHRLIERGRTLERAVWEKKQAEVNLKWEQRLRSSESQALAQLNKLKEDHAKSLETIRLRLDDTLRKLRERPTREAAKASGNLAPASQSCTGVQLARDDGEFLARFAQRAAVQGEELARVTGDYEACRRALKEITNGDERGTE